VDRIVEQVVAVEIPVEIIVEKEVIKLMPI
jgi:hypothetical protein